MAAPLYLTKGELRSKLLLRLGYGGLGAGAGMFVPTADDLLDEAQEQLFQIFTDEKGVREWEFSTGVNQRWYDIPETCDIDRILGMWAQQNGDYWHPLTRGIDAAHDSDFDDIHDYPYNYDIRARELRSVINLQDNGQMSIEDTSATGTIPGWTWTSGLATWQIKSGVAECTSSGQEFLYSSVVIVPSQVYTIEYDIILNGAPNLQSVAIGINSTDIYGIDLGRTNGHHRHVIQAATNGPLTFEAFTNQGVYIDNVSVVEGNLDLPADETVTQIEVWPKPDQAYPMKIEGPMVLAPFVNDGDRASFDSRLILLYAIAYGKAHLGRQDAKSAMDAWTLRLNRIKANQHGTRKYVRRNPSKPERHVLARPKVI